MPDRMKNDTKEYLNNNDPVQQFLGEQIEKTFSEKDFVPSSELYESFKGFYGGDNKNISTMNFKNILTKVSI